MRKVRARQLAAIAGVSASMLLGATAASAIPQPPDLVILFNIAGACEFSLMSSQTSLGQPIQFTNSSGSSRTVSDKAGFWSFTIGSKDALKTMNHAGTYTWLCDADPASSVPIERKPALVAVPFEHRDAHGADSNTGTLEFRDSL